MNPIIDVQHLSFHYDEQPVLEDVTFQVQPGEFLGVIGPNGGGKTTLLRILLGLEKNYTGTVRLLGEDPARGRAWRQRVGVVPQNRDYPVRFPICGRGIVELGTHVNGGPKLSPSARRERVNEALSLVGAAAFAEKPLWQLSGGQKQRLFVARALASRPEVLFLDEPTVGVDAQGQDLLLEWIARWRKQTGLTVILVTHDIGVIAPLADKLACLSRRLHFHDRPEMLTGEAIEKAYGCPAELVFHSPHALPHVVLGEHPHDHVTS
jgi:zinc transport system ATP-binding protein